MTTSQFKRIKNEIKLSTETSFTVETDAAINIFESSNCDLVLQKYGAMLSKVQSIKIGSHYGF